MPISSKVLRCLLLCLILPVAVRSEGTKDQLSDQTADDLGKTKTLADAGNSDAALAVVEGRLSKVESESFDAAVLLQIDAQLRLQKSATAETADPLARSLDLADRHGYFDAAARTQMAYLLAQLRFQSAASAAPDAAKAAMDQAMILMDRWERETAKPNFDAVFFHASLLYNRAVGGGAKPDTALLQRALAELDKAGGLAIRLPDTYYQLKVACLQQLGAFADAAEALEHLAETRPADGNTWLQLVGAYLSDAATAKDAKAAYAANVRAIVAIERAQAGGFMKTPKDQFNLIGLHFNIQQYDRAIDLLSAGLRDGTIAADQKNWELLAFSYRQTGRDEEALGVLQQAATRFSQSGQLEFQIAQVAQSLDRPADAIAHLRQCIAKGGGDTPPSAYLFLSYLLLEAKDYAGARDAAASAMKYPEGLKEGQRMKSAIEDVMAARDANPPATPGHSAL